MANTPEDFTHKTSPSEELLELHQDIREELRQIRECSVQQRYQRNEVESIRVSILDATRDMASSIEALQKDLATKLAPLSQLPKALELGKDLTKLVDDSAFLLAKKLDDISKTLN